MFYFDTSFLAPLVLAEPTSEQVSEFIRGLPGESLAVSHWTRVEFSSLIAREVRTGEIDAVSGARADARFDALIAASFAVLLPAATDFELAKLYVLNFATGLRAGDALHLAVAKNNGAEAIYSLDRTMLSAGKALGLPVSIGIDPG